MATKAELEFETSQYYEWIKKARASLRVSHFCHATEMAERSWPFIAGMIQYERRYENTSKFTIEAIEIVLKYSPLLFEYERLRNLDGFLKSERRITKYTSLDIFSRLEEANLQMRSAHQLWNLLERHSEIRQDLLTRELGRDLKWWRHLCEVWQAVELIELIPLGNSCRLAFCTEMDGIAVAKCCSCGAKVRAAKARFLAQIRCPKCQVEGLFVLLKRDLEVVNKD